jgi:hypothetical protein
MYKIKDPFLAYSSFNVRLWVVFIIISNCTSITYSQCIELRIGQTQTSTPFRTSTGRQSGDYLLFTPKRGWAGEIGVEYAIKPKSSFHSSFAFYESGATQEEYNVLGQNPLFFFNLEDNEYTYNCWSLNTNYNMEIWRVGKVKLMAIAGLHVDRLIFNGDDSYGWVNDNDDRNPLRILSRNDALRRTNFGCNLGGRAVYNANRWSYSLNYTYAPRFIKMGKYSAKVEDVGSAGLNGLTVKEKVSFLTIGVGFNLKGNK